MTVRRLFRRAMVRGRRRRGGDAPLAIFLYHSVVRRRPRDRGLLLHPRRGVPSSARRACRGASGWCSLEEGARLLDARRELREPTAVITFDDGFQDNFDVAYPAAGGSAARRRRSSFAPTSSTPTRFPWYCRLHDALTRTRGTDLDWDGRRYDLDERAAPGTRAATAAQGDAQTVAPLRARVRGRRDRVPARADAGPRASGALDSAVPHPQPRGDAGDGARRTGRVRRSYRVARDPLQARAGRATRRDRAVDRGGERR